MPRKFYKEDNEAIPAIKFELSQPAGFTEITDQAEIKELYLRQYHYRMLEGQEYVQDVTADTYIKALNGLYTDVEAFHIESNTQDLNKQ